MSLYKKPLPRPKRLKGNIVFSKPTKGTLLYSILNPEPTQVYTFQKAPIYQQECYIRLLETISKKNGISFTKPDLPEYNPPVKNEKITEPEITYPDRVQVKLKVLKSGIVRVKLDTSLISLYEKYYSKNKFPPSKSVIQAYKSMGFSKEFLTKLKNNYAKNIEKQKRFEKVIDKIFNKEPVKKIKKKKKEEEEYQIEKEKEKDEDEDNDDDDLHEENEMDVEIDDDNEDVVEEEYYSDMDD